MLPSNSKVHFTGFYLGILNSKILSQLCDFFFFFVLRWQDVPNILKKKRLHYVIMKGKEVKSYTDNATSLVAYSKKVTE